MSTRSQLMANANSLLPNPNGCADVGPSWYALYVKHKHEKKVARSLASRDVSVFVPTQARTHSNGRSFESPLFPGYVFCQLDLDYARMAVSVPGVFGIVSQGVVPSPISPEEIESVRCLLAAGLLVKTVEYLAAGQEITLADGPFRGVRGTVLDVSDERWLIVSIRLLRRSIAVKLARQSVQAWM